MILVRRRILRAKPQDGRLLLGPQVARHHDEGRAAVRRGLAPRVLDRDHAADQARLRPFVGGRRRRRASPADQDPDQQTQQRHQSQQGALHVQNAARNGDLVRVQGRSKPGLRRTLLVVGGVGQLRFRIVDEDCANGSSAGRSTAGVGLDGSTAASSDATSAPRSRAGICNTCPHFGHFSCAPALRTLTLNRAPQCSQANLIGMCRRECLRRVTRRGNRGGRRRSTPAALVRPIRVACR